MALNNSNQGVTTNYVTLMDPLFEKLNISESVFKQFGDQFSTAYKMIRKMNAMKAVDQVKFYHFEDTRIAETLIVAANATAAGPGLPLTFQLDAASVGPNGASFARKFFNVIFPSYAEATITSVVVTPGSPPTVDVTVVPKDGTLTLSVSAGQQLAVGAPNFGEGTTQPKGISPTLVRRDFSTQIMKEAFRNSGSAATNAAVVNMQELASSYANPTEMMAQINAMGLGNTFVLYGQRLVDARHSMQVALAFYFGQDNTNSVTPIIDTDPEAMDGTVRATKGLYHQIQDRGGVLNYPVGAFSISDYDAVADYLNTQNVSPLQAVLHILGSQQQRNIEDAFISSNATNYVTYDSDKANRQIFAGSSKALNMSYVEATKGNFTFIQVQESFFHDPAAMGAPGYDTPNLGFIIPLAQGRDPKSRDLMDSMALRYKALGGVNRAYKVWSRDERQTNYDISELELIGDMGFQFFGVNRMVCLEGQ